MKQPSPFLTLCLIIAFPLLLPAQQRLIQGCIKNALYQPVADALVTLQGAGDSLLLARSFSDSLGRYSLTFMPQDSGAVRCAVFAAGYEPYSTEVDPGMQGVVLPDIVLQQKSASLDEVTISAAKPLLERRADRIIFNVAGRAALAGASALDAVQRTPGILLSRQDNSLRLAGKSAVQILIDDRLQQLSGEDLIAYLASIPAAQIERIEIITAPGAQYDASGNTGLVNIVLKKSPEEGLYGQLRLGYEQASYGKGIAGGDFGYRKGRLSLSANGQYSRGANQISERLRTPYPEQVFDVSDDYRRTQKPLQYNINGSYRLGGHGLFSMQFTSGIHNRWDSSNNVVRALASPSLQLDSAMQTLGRSIRRSNTYTVNAGYVLRSDSGDRKLTLNLNRLWFDGRRSVDFGTDNYADELQTPTGIATKNKTYGTQSIRITTAQADVELPWLGAAWSMGAKLSFIDNGSDNHFSYFDQGTYRDDPAISNAFDYRERVQAAYASASRTFGKWELQAGLRAEYTQTRGISRILAQTNSNRYLNLFPGFFVQYNQRDNMAWSLSYGKRINRPDYRSLDPFRAYSSPYHYGEGNPFLRPSFSHNAALNWIYKGRYTVSFSYQYERDHFGQVWMVDSARNITSGLSRNFAGLSGWGLDLNAGLQPLKAWEAQLSLSGQLQELRSAWYAGKKAVYRIPVLYAGLFNNISLNTSQTFIAEVNLFYLSRYREDFLEINPTGSVDIALKALWLDKRLVTTLGIADLLRTQRARGGQLATGQAIDNYFDTRNVRVTVQYRIGSESGKKPARQKTGIEDEQERAR